ncbi:hypothetical protein TRFO_30425 [Tritrichomonas foetus]|uniref:C2 domain-containing protein n=1 Tax=Tritrichomonas foetus TaxID=1144522 RepID=A0A1J4JYU1_9EUKA|nr:hypothetical protein TRFO_30425 [Tritrichomonas foetus]|eukprot:OHT02437.1 hypothetical protein TRFO_30425 [Tritrichomonas foetus]
MKLDIQVFAAKNLPRINPKSRQFPYCLVQIKDVAESFQTQAIKSSTSPEWNESFTFPRVNSKEVEVNLTVMHKDKVISFVSFTLFDIVDGSEIDQWIDLTPENEKFKGGQIHVHIMFTEDLTPGDHEEEEDFADQQDEFEQQQYQQQEQEDVGQMYEDDQTNYAPNIPYSPHRTPDLKRTKERIANDNGDADAIIENASRMASQRYNSFLRARAPMLIDNEKRMERVRQEMNAEDDE